MKNMIVVAALLAIVGCASEPPAPPPVTRVEIPVPVPCRTKKVEVPAFAAEGLKKSDTLEVKARALMAERLQRIGYEVKLLAANAACQ